MTWHKIAEHINEIDFAENDIAVAEVNNKKICIGKYKENLFAFAYKCPHAGGFLAQGFIDVLGNVVCPQHRYKYSMQNGRNVTGEGFFLKTWLVEIREDGIFVALENNQGVV
jgi:3-phenylpropionate/trans-cinnamate dioxygenase ferredoxin subunit